jgi:S1-C subfamily serine protease
MTQLLSQVSESIANLVASASPSLTAIRIGQNRHATGFLWRNDLIVTSDQALPAAANYTIVLPKGALIAARPGPRDPVNNLASLRLDDPVSVRAFEPSGSATVGALVLVLGAEFDASPTLRLTTVHGFPRRHAAVSMAAAITLDLAGARASQGGMVLDAEGRLLGMTSVSTSGDAVVVPHEVICRFVEAITAGDQPLAAETALLPPAAQPIPLVTVPESGSRNGHASGHPSPASSVRRGWLGVSLQPITVPDGLMHRAGQRTARQVVNITRGGPAERAGLRTGDVLLALDGSSTTGNHALRAFLQAERIGSRVEIRLMRDGLVHTTILTIAEQPDE